MILFLDDWRKYDAIADLHTPNQSYVRLAAVYREMGIQNHMFHLALHDRTLQGVDPHALDLTLEQQLRVAHECAVNPWYFFREVIKVPAQSGMETPPLLGNRGNIAMWWCFFNHILTILIQARQTGKSLSSDALATLLLNILCKKTQINLLTKDDTLRSANIERLKEMDKTLPKYLQQRTKADVNNSEEITIRQLGNHYRAHLPQKQEKMANNVGRGLTSPIFFIDEGPFQPHIGTAMPAALAAGTAARERAELNGEPYGTLVTTTAGKRDDRDGKWMYNFVSEAAEWTEKFFDCKDRVELEETVRTNSRTGQERINITMNHLQLGKDDAWLKKAVEGAIATGEAADRDFGNVWTSGNTSHPLPLHILEAIRDGVIGVNHTSISKIGGYLTRWYIDEHTKEGYLRNGRFVMSMDTSDASGGDDISLLLTDTSNGETVASGTYNETNLITLAEWITSEWIEKYENITVCIERKSSGVAILDYLLLILPTKNIDPFKRLFNRIVNEHDEMPDKYREIQQPLGRRANDIYVRFKKAFGFATAGTGVTSRTELFSGVLQNAAKRFGTRIRDLTTVNQIAGLEERKGRIDHAEGEHDDMVIAWLLNAWLLTKAKNLSYYGIMPKDILTRLGDAKEIPVEEAYDNAEQRSLRDEMQKVLEQLKNTNDELMVQKLERRLFYLDSRIIFEEGEKLSLDELINSVREEKRKRRSLHSQSFAQANINHSALHGGYGARNRNIPTHNLYGAYRDPMRVF